MADTIKIYDPKAQYKRLKAVLPWFCALAIAIAVFWVFSPTLEASFTNYDDATYVTNNVLVVNNKVPVAKIFQTSVSLHYHPLTILSLALNYQFGKLDPVSYHFVNVCLHILNTILVFIFIYLLTGSNLLMTVVCSLLFGIHPMHVESVAWISERKDVLYVFFFLLGLISYLQYGAQKRNGWYILAFVSFVLSCLSKEMAIIFPFMLLLIDYFKGVKQQRWLMVEKLPFFIFAIIICVIEVKIQKGNATRDLQIFTMFQRILFASYSAIMYIVKFVVPYKLSAFYPYPDTGKKIPAIFYLSPVILLGLLTALFYLYKKGQKEIVFGLLFYFVAIVLVVQFIPVNPGIIPDRYSYLSYIGLIFIVAYSIDSVWKAEGGITSKLKYPVSVIVLAGCIIYGYSAFSRTMVWNSSESLWTDVINKHPDVALAYMSRGEYYQYNSHEAKKAMADYDTALRAPLTSINTLKDIYYNRALLYSDYYQNLDSAITDYTKAIALFPNYAEAYNNRGSQYLRKGKYDLATSDFNKAIALDAGSASIYNNRGLIYLNDGKINLAVADFRKAIALDSGDADAYNNLGLLYMRQNKYDSAIINLNYAIAINPDVVGYYYNRGLSYNALNDFEKAAEDYSDAIQLSPENDVLYNLRGICYVHLKNYKDALGDFSNAIDIKPSNATYWLNRSVVENKTGKTNMAKTDALKAKQLQGK